MSTPRIPQRSARTWFYIAPLVLLAPNLGLAITDPLSTDYREPQVWYYLDNHNRAIPLPDAGFQRQDIKLLKAL